MSYTVKTDDTQVEYETNVLGVVKGGTQLYRVKIEVRSVGAGFGDAHDIKLPELILTSRTMAESGLIALASEKAGIQFLPERDL